MEEERTVGLAYLGECPPPEDTHQAFGGEAKKEAWPERGGVMNTPQCLAPKDARAHPRVITVPLCTFSPQNGHELDKKPFFMQLGQNTPLQRPHFTIASPHRNVSLQFGHCATVHPRGLESADAILDSSLTCCQPGVLVQTELSLRRCIGNRGR